MENEKPSYRHGYRQHTKAADARYAARNLDQEQPKRHRIEQNRAVPDGKILKSHETKTQRASHLKQADERERHSFTGRHINLVSHGSPGYRDKQGAPQQAARRELKRRNRRKCIFDENPVYTPGKHDKSERADRTLGCATTQNASLRDFDLRNGRPRADGVDRGLNPPEIFLRGIGRRHAW